MQAALNGSKEIGFTIVSMTLSLSAVFIPVLFMSGLLGRLLHEFAVTIVCAVLVSGFVSLTLTPMMCSRFVHPEHGRKHGRLYNFFERFFDGMRNTYDRTLQVVLRHRRATLIVSLVIFLITLFLFVVIPKGFFPSEDTGQISAITEASQDISFDAMKEHQKVAMKIVAADPNVDGFMSSIGAGGASSTLNNGRIFMRLKPRSERKLNADQIIQELRVKLAQVPGFNVYMQNPPLIRIGGMASKALYQYSLQDTDTKELFHWAPILKEKMAQLPGLQDVTSDLQIANPQVNVDIDRDKASALGVTAQQIENASTMPTVKCRPPQFTPMWPNIGSYSKLNRNFNSTPTRWGNFISAVRSPIPIACLTLFLEHRCQAHAQHRSNDHSARRPVAVCPPFLSTSYPAWRSARPKVKSKTFCRFASAGDGHRQLSGRGAGFPILATGNAGFAHHVHSHYLTSFWESFMKASSIH